jgi:uncharacterized integral membrane protein
VNITTHKKLLLITLTGSFKKLEGSFNEIYFIYKKNLTQVTVLFLSLLLSGLQPDSNPSQRHSPCAGQCTNFTVTRSTPGADALSVTFIYNTSAGLAFNGTSLGSYTAAIPSGQTTSAVMSVCSTTSSMSTTTTSVTLSNSSYTVAGAPRAS